MKLYVTGNTVKLTISEAMLTDAGSYELIAENALGSIDCAAKLTVHCTLNIPPLERISSFYIVSFVNFSTTNYSKFNSIANQCSYWKSFVYFV